MSIMFRYDVLPPVTSEEEEEPPYETLPSLQYSEMASSSKDSNEPNDHIEDNSVISAHHSGVYDYIKDKDIVTLGSLKHKILLSDDLGDETRL